MEQKLLKYTLCFIAPARSIHTRRWVRAFSRRQDYSVTLISPSGPPPPESNLGPAEIVWFHAPDRQQPRLMRYVHLSRQYWRMRGYVIDHSFDLVHVHQLPRPLTVPFLWRIPGLVVSPWGSDIVNLPGESPSLVRELSRRFILRQAEAVTATSRFLAEVAESYAPSEKKIEVVPFGVNLDLFAPPSSCSRPAPPPVRLITTKYLRPRYGLHYLVESLGAIARVARDIELLIAGDGPQRPDLETLVHRQGIDHIVRFVGSVPHTQIVSLLQASHIYVMPSISESFGVAAAEAQAVGLPVVGSRVGGVPEVVLDGQTGLLVPPRDTGALADALLQLINDPKLRARMGQAGRKHVATHYDWNLNVMQMHRVYQETMKQNPIPNLPSPRDASGPA